MPSKIRWLPVVALLALMLVLSGGAALRECVTFDEVAHIGAGLSYWQRLDLRMNAEHPPLAKLVAGLPRITRARRGKWLVTSSPRSARNGFSGMGSWGGGTRGNRS